MKETKKWQLIAWPLATNLNLGFMIAMMMMAMTGSTVYPLTAVVIGLVATMSRIFDGFTDPIIAFLMENFNSKFGKVRILLMFGWSLIAVSTLMLFIVGPSIEAGTIFYIVGNVLYVFGYTIGGISINMGTFALTKNDFSHRLIVGRNQTMYATIVGSLVGGVMYSVLQPKYLDQDVPDNVGFLFAVGTFALAMSVVLLVVALLAVTPQDKQENFTGGAGKRLKVSEILAVLKRSRNLKAFMVAAASDKLSMAAAGQAIIVTCLYGIILGDSSWGGTMQIILMFPTIIFIFLAAKYATGGGRKVSLVRWSMISIITAAALWGFLIFTASTTFFESVVLLSILIILNIAMKGATMTTTVVTGAMLTDVIVDEGKKSGKDMPATIIALYTFIDKTISAFATTIVALCFALIGFSENLPQLTDAATPQIFAVTTFIMFGLPIFGYICSIIAMKFYELE